MSNLIIYKALNHFSEECYVGTTSKSLDERKKDHIFKADNGSDVKFHQAIASYGPDTFVWEQIDVASNHEELAFLETKYIEKYDSFKNGYNSDRGGGLKKPVYQFDLSTGELVNSFKDLQSAGNAVNATKTSISNACLGYAKTCKGFFWSYSEKSGIPEVDRKKKRVLQLTLDEELISRFNSVSEASRITGISKTCISRCCRGERPQTSGFIFRYA